MILSLISLALLLLFALEIMDEAFCYKKHQILTMWCLMFLEIYWISISWPLHIWYYTNCQKMNKDTYFTLQIVFVSKVAKFVFYARVSYIEMNGSVELFWKICAYKYVLGHHTKLWSNILLWDYLYVTFNHLQILSSLRRCWIMAYQNDMFSSIFFTFIPILVHCKNKIHRVISLIFYNGYFLMAPPNLHWPKHLLGPFYHVCAQICCSLFYLFRYLSSKFGSNYELSY